MIAFQHLGLSMENFPPARDLLGSVVPRDLYIHRIYILDVVDLGHEALDLANLCCMGMGNSGRREERKESSTTPERPLHSLDEG